MAASREYADGRADLEAIEALRLIASSRSVHILGQARRKNKRRAKLVDGAVKWMRSHRPVLAGTDLDEVARGVAQALGIGWQSNGRPRYNQEGDMALVNSVFVTADDEVTYTATFHKVDGVWKLHALRYTIGGLVW